MEMIEATSDHVESPSPDSYKHLTITCYKDIFTFLLINTIKLILVVCYSAHFTFLSILYPINLIVVYDKKYICMANLIFVIKVKHN